jgi:hypothetical protein
LKQDLAYRMRVADKQPLHFTDGKDSYSVIVGRTR